MSRLVPPLRLVRVADTHKIQDSHDKDRQDITEEEEEDAVQKWRSVR